MLHSTPTDTLTNGNQENKNGLNNLTMKMQQSLDTLESIQSLLKNRNSIHQEEEEKKKKRVEEEVNHDKALHLKRINELEKECGGLRSDLEKKNGVISEKTDSLHQARQRIGELQQSLTTLSTKHDQNYSELQQQYNEAINKCHQANLKNDQLKETIEELDEAHKMEINRRQEIESSLKKKIQEQENLLQEKVELMKTDILIYQEKLSEKITQNKELELTIERITRHNTILKTSLNESRRESTERYNKMLYYMNKN